MNLLRDERGQVLVTTLCCMGILLGALGLAVDVGVLFHARRNMQTAADAAAMAGATELFYNGTSSVSTKAYAAAKANGVDNTVAGNNVIVTVGPTIGGSTCASCVEVQLSTPNQTVFMATLGQLFSNSNSYTSVNVSAMAVAGAPGVSNNCVYVMDPTDADSLWIHGAANINAPGCGVYVNSNNPGALCVTGSAGKSTALDIDVVGGQDTKGNCKGSPGPTVYPSAPVETPPLLAKLPTSPASNCKTVTTVTSLSGTIAGPGYGKYACYTNSSGAAVTLNGASMGPGNYVFESGVTISGTTVIGTGTGSTTSTNGGATLIITGSSSGTYSFDSSSASNLSIYAPADNNATYNGIALYQPTSVTQEINLQFGSSSSYFMGAVVAPGADVNLHDQGGAVNAADLLVSQVYINGTINLANYSTYNPTTSPFRVITLVQ